jgi:ribonuclease HI
MVKKNYLTWLKKIENLIGPSPAIDEIREKIQSLPETVKKEEFQELPPPLELADFSQGVLVVTDGACRGNPGPGAWAIVAQNKAGEILYQDAGFEKQTTNNRMELRAAIKGLDFFSKCPQNHKLIFMSDSKYVVEGISQWMQNWKQRGWKKADGKTPENVDLWQEMDEVLNNVPPHEIRWVKGHSGHPQNEFCDQLCNKTLDDENTF